MKPITADTPPRKTSRLPFAGMGRDAWIRLAVLALFLFELFQFAIPIAGKVFPDGLGYDYLAFWSTGGVADTQGYAKVYDLEALRKAQAAALAPLGLTTDELGVVPAPVPPVFVVPFQFLSRIEMSASFALWTALNLAGYALYAWFFARKVRPAEGLTKGQVNLLLLILISLPAFQNFFVGNIKLLVLVSAGEFLRAGLNKRPVLAGAWLGGLLVNPHLLVLVVPALLALRSWKVLLGFAASSAVVGAVSLALAGFEGILNMVRLWLGYSQGLATNVPQYMMNWRALAVVVNWLASPLGWALTVLGMAATLWLGWRIVRRRPALGSPEWAVAMLGIFAATCAVTWHAHLHAAMVLLPLLAYAVMHRLLPERVVSLWGWGWPVVNLAVIVVSLATGGEGVTNEARAVILGLTGLALNLWLVVKAERGMKVREGNSRLSENHQPASA